jgi:hypothetical protein
MTPGGSPMAERQLGTGFVPNSPEATAEQIAGSQAQAEARELLGPPPDASQAQESQLAASQQAAESASQASPASSQQAAANANAPPQDGAPTSESAEQAQASTRSTGKAAKSGRTPMNPGPEDKQARLDPAQQGDSRAADSGEDADVKARKLEKEPWFSKLPASMQQGRAARGRGKLPPGYEDLLKRYFEVRD